MQTLAKYKKICYHKQADLDDDKKRPHGQAVKTLPSHGRICGSIPHGATKKIQHHLVWCCIFLYAPERKRRGNLLPSFVFASANFAVGSHRPHLYFPISYIWETATSAWGYVLLRCVKRRGNLFAVVRQFAQANSCRRLPSPALLLSYQLHMGNGNFRMGRYYFFARKKLGNFIFI